MRTSWGLLLSSVLTLLTALAACISAIGSHRAAKQSRRYTHAQVMNSLLDIYDLTVVFWLMIDDLSSRHGQLLLGK